MEKRQYIMETSRSMVTTLEISLTHLTQFKDFGFYWTFSEQNTANLIKLDVSEINLKPLFEDNVGMECGQLKLPTSLAKN